eukprot:CAMPEP_0113688862 /NCGR_PEP_ID=MMETSP0038_2-20120614/16797_1 /TAXON_ID=2898 /ORGANISM="Cryptomonas paramecium" /LENGTH=263 /DNA_ID=CAMNT_0000609775 /DNA_START=274 /DNA_END=1061 /DNA_ORIENTATION=- /assembly_acc=CAM_ASM_000170
MDDMINLDSESLFLNEDLFGSDAADGGRQINRGGSFGTTGNDDSGLLDSQLSTDSLGSLGGAQQPQLGIPDSPEMSMLWGMNQDQSSQSAKFGQPNPAAAQNMAGKANKRPRMDRSASSMRLQGDGSGHDPQNVNRNFGPNGADDLGGGMGNQWDNSGVGGLDDPSGMMPMGMDSSNVAAHARMQPNAMQASQNPMMQQRMPHQGFAGNPAQQGMGPSGMGGPSAGMQGQYMQQGMNAQPKPMQASMNQPMANAGMGHNAGHG